MKKEHAVWIDYYVRCGDAVEAVGLAYPHIQPQSRATKASYLKNLLALDINNAAHAQYGKEAPMMMSVIKDLALNASQDAVRLKSADTWLSRAGHDAALVVETKETATHEELIKRLAIVAQGLPKEILEQVLGVNLTQQITQPKEETTHGTKH